MRCVLVSLFVVGCSQAGLGSTGGSGGGRVDGSAVTAGVTSSSSHASSAATSSGSGVEPACNIALDACIAVGPAHHVVTFDPFYTFYTHRPAWTGSLLLLSDRLGQPNGVDLVALDGDGQEQWRQWVPGDYLSLAHIAYSPQLQRGIFQTHHDSDAEREVIHLLGADGRPTGEQISGLNAPGLLGFAAADGFALTRSHPAFESAHFASANDALGWSPLEPDAALGAYGTSRAYDAQGYARYATHIHDSELRFFAIADDGTLLRDEALTFYGESPWYLNMHGGAVHNGELHVIHFPNTVVNVHSDVEYDLGDYKPAHLLSLGDDLVVFHSGLDVMARSLDGSAQLTLTSSTSHRYLTALNTERGFAITLWRSDGGSVQLYDCCSPN